MENTVERTRIIYYLIMSTQDTYYFVYFVNLKKVFDRVRRKVMMELFARKVVDVRLRRATEWMYVRTSNLVSTTSAGSQGVCQESILLVLLLFICYLG